MTVEFLYSALAGVERPIPEQYPEEISKRLDRLSSGARITYRALVLCCANNVHGAVYATRGAIARMRRDGGSSERGNSERTISTHLRLLEDAGLLVRFSRRVNSSWHSLVLLLGYCIHVGAMVPLSGATCLFLAWGARGLCDALRDRLLTEPLSISGPYVDSQRPERGRRKLLLHTYLPPRRSSEVRGVTRDSRITRHPAVYRPIQEACLRLLASPAAPYKVCRFSADLVKRGVWEHTTPDAAASECSAPGGAGCTPAQGGGDAGRALERDALVAHDGCLGRTSLSSEPHASVSANRWRPGPTGSSLDTENDAPSVPGSLNSPRGSAEHPGAKRRNSEAS